ncbi:MAG: hypothetical protein V4734_07930 [Terriglobus sp.]
MIFEAGCVVMKLNAQIHKLPTLTIVRGALGFFRSPVGLQSKRECARAVIVDSRG